MQRRSYMPERPPIIFWLLLAATISIDAVVFPLAASGVPPALAAVSPYAHLTADALIVSQLCIICIWAALSSKKIIWLSAILAAIVAAFTATVVIDPEREPFNAWKLYLAYYGLVSALLVSALWLFRGSKYWRRRTGVAYSLQYSLAQLLIAMTVAAVLMTIVRSGPFQGNDQWVNIGLVVSIVALAAASAVIWSLSYHWLLQFAATIGVGIAVSIALGFAVDKQPFVFEFAMYFLIQAVVLSAWLGLGEILPARSPT
jgi:hypothetical protein